MKWYLMFNCTHCEWTAETPLLDAEVVNNKMILVCDECGEKTTVKSLHMVAHEHDCADILYHSAVAFPKET